MSETLTLPVLPLDDEVVLPGMVVPLETSQPEVGAAIDDTVQARFQPLDARDGNRQHVVVQDVVDVGANRRQHVELVKIAAGTQEHRVHHVIDDQRRAPAECLELLCQLAGLRGPGVVCP